jgi:pimeloyl-ACP methyl ester carboxylesterase
MMARFEHDGVTLAYDEGGDQDAPPVVLLHGVSDSRLSWADLPTRLADHNRVLAPDFRGHGDSDRTPGEYVLSRYAGDVIALCERVLDRPSVFVGHSLGGVVAAHVAATRPDLVRGAFLEDPPLFLVADPGAFDSSVYALIFPWMQMIVREAQATDDPEAALRAAVRSAPAMSGQGTLADSLGPDGTDRTVYGWLHFDPDVFDQVLDGTALGGYDPDAAISCPVTLVRADPAMGGAFNAEHEERFTRMAPSTEYIFAEGCSHQIHTERPEWFAERVLEFLNGL